MDYVSHQPARSTSPNKHKSWTLTIIRIDAWKKEGLSFLGIGGFVCLFRCEPTILLGREKTDSRQVHIPDNEARAMVLVGTIIISGGCPCLFNYRRMCGSKGDAQRYFLHFREIN